MRSTSARGFDVDKKFLVATVGLPRSGKTTWARSTGRPIVCPDAIRLALHEERFIKAAEPMVWAIAACMVRSLFLAGHDVVVFDATNTSKKRRDSLLEWAEINGEEDLYQVRFKSISASEAECIARASNENDEYIIPIIRSMAEKWEPLLESEKEYSYSELPVAQDSDAVGCAGV